MSAVPLSNQLRGMVILAGLVVIVAVVAFYIVHVVDYPTFLGLGALAIALVIFVLAEHRFDRLEARFDKMEKCCEELKARLDRIEKRLDPQP